MHSEEKKRGSGRFIYGLPVLVAALLTMGLSITFSAAEERMKDSEVWAASGDSITVNRFWQWTDIVAQETGNVLHIPPQKHGSTIVALERLEYEILAHKPDLVFVMIGINDQWIRNGSAPDEYAVPPAKFAANLDLIITQIQVTGAKVVLMTNRPLIQGPGAPNFSFYLDRNGDGGALYTLPRKVKDSIQLYNDIIRAKAKEHGTHLVDIWQAIVDVAGSDSDADLLALGLGRPGKKLDGVHVGPGGARFIAQTVLDAMPFD